MSESRSSARKRTQLGIGRRPPIFPDARIPGQLTYGWQKARKHWRNRNLELDQRRARFRLGLPYVNAASYAGEDDGANPDAMLVMVESAKRPGVSDARDDLQRSPVC
jgi:hypothetical protein